MYLYCKHETEKIIILLLRHFFTPCSLFRMYTNSLMYFYGCLVSHWSLLIIKIWSQPQKTLLKTVLTTLFTEFHTVWINIFWYPVKIWISNFFYNTVFYNNFFYNIFFLRLFFIMDFFYKIFFYTDYWQKIGGNWNYT